MSSKRSPNLYQEDNIYKHRKTAVARLLQRQERDQKANPSILNSANIVVLSDGSFGTCPSVMLSSENAHCLFNCGAGLQRLATANTIKIADLEDIFITNLSHQRGSGLLGLALTLQDMGTRRLCIHSNESIVQLFKSARSFINFNTGIDCSAVSYNLDRTILKDGLIVQEIPIRRVGSKPARPDDKIIAYLCLLPDLPGHLDPHKCKELRVPIGPMLAKLKSGLDITLEDGTVVKSSDVVSEKNHGLKILFLECPSRDDIDAFEKCQLLTSQKDSQGSSKSQPIDIVFHMTPSEVSEHNEYQSFIDTFGQSCKHIFLTDKKSEQLPYINIYRTNYLLRQLDDMIFPEMRLPGYMNEKISTEMQKKEGALVTTSGETKYVAQLKYEESGRIIKMSTLDRLSIRPNRLFEIADSTLEMDRLYQEAKINPEFGKCESQLRKFQQTLAPPKEYEPEVVFLGTGSAIPSKHRNTTCILINSYYPKEKSVILDCGEDSYGQLHRLYGPEGAEKILRQLKLIYISHHHTDHHIGLSEILYRRKQFTNEPLTLILPPGIEQLLNFNHKTFGNLYDTFKLYSSKILKHQYPDAQEIYKNIELEIRAEIIKDLNGLLEDIMICRVDHCANATGIMIKFKIGHQELDTYSIAYSGDCRPSEDFIDIAKDCDLLIHEATFDHLSTGDAISKKHSTTSEAIQVAKKMNTKFMIMTHFSQRYPKIPYFTDEFDDEVGVAFDMLSVKCPSQLCRLPALRPILSVVYKQSLTDVKLYHTKIKRRSDMIQNLISECTQHKQGA